MRFELAPDPDQVVLMARHAGLSRVVENFCLEIVCKKPAQRRAEETYGLSGDQLTEVPWTAPALERAWRETHPTRFPWFSEDRLSSRVPKEACRARAAGFANWLASRNGNRQGARVRFPKWRKRKHGNRFRYDADRAKPVDPHAVWLPGIGPVATRENMSWLTDRLAADTARILGSSVRERAGRWWISFQLEVDRDEINARRRVPEGAPKAGIDLGLNRFAVIVDEDGSIEELRAPKPLTQAQRALKRANRRLARCQPQSNNWRKARTRVAALHLRIAHRRIDFLHKTTTRLARTKSVLAVETLNVKGMSANRRLARGLADAGFYEFMRQLEYKAGWYGSRVWKADRWFPSTRTCGDCGLINSELTLADREWVCPRCAVTHDRDHNAARNLLVAFLTENENIDLAGKFPGEVKRLAETA
ncbi:RNA-guided endonuclease TnpB family protein [Nocardia sp. CDC153]|uniref:RNA-guided endonuclease InsQ/TnpB family protein n=1 Tax=Nocardia sp. CDC153 TaxID=3112167 RepID=UPI002DB737BF|nr:RNA-guided endonuclease TnpB family protein [Nocardia sp. CDC153]MEC3955392.1 RNA-guided endonuclease TnpB family protein [Nocardia sp. CDC153]